ncbi:MAG: hypothetical protein ACRCS6_09890, partial [Turicibacter sp.]
MIKSNSEIQGEWVGNRKKIICSIILTLMLVMVTGLLVFNLAWNETILNQDFHNRIQEETNLYENLQKNLQIDLNLLMEQEELSLDLVLNLLTYEEVSDFIQIQTKALSDFYSGKTSELNLPNLDKQVKEFEFRMANSGKVDYRISDEIRRILDKHLQLVPDEMDGNVDGIGLFIKNIYTLRRIFTVPLLSIAIGIIISILAIIWKNNLIDVLLYMSISGFGSGFLITFIFIFYHKIIFSSSTSSSIGMRKNLYHITFNRFFKEMYMLGSYILMAAIICVIILITIKEI